MDLRYEAFCFADPLFFDEQRQAADQGDAFAATLPLPPEGWREEQLGIWRSLRPESAALPAQGWKIHVSAGLDNADRVLRTAHRYCLDRGIAFKHLRTRSILLSRNSKYAPRAASGKLITIYPVDDEQFSRVLAELSAALDGEPGPYILSDLRYGAGPLFVRYGGFLQRWMEADGARVLAISRPDGTLVPDRREPRFSVPDWVELPECLAPHVAARRAGDPAAFPYRVTSSLHFSNGGGVYLARRLADDQEVVLKEARPYAGLDRDRTDAVARLRREYEVLYRLRGIPGIPAAHDLFAVWEHLFLAMEKVEGRALGPWLARHYPLIRHEPGEREIADYTRRALALVDRVARLLDRVHERGVVFGDLHALNILVDEDGDDTVSSVSLIDFEMAFPVDSPGRPALGAPGFRAPRDRTGFAIDHHALAALKLWIFLPLNPLLELAPGKLPALVDFVERRFPLPADYGAEILRELAPRKPVPPATTELDQPDPDWGVVRKSLATAILASATPHRTDRLFPGDIEQFRVGGAGFGYGAAGVLHALDVAGAGRYPEHERWLLAAVHREPPTRPGFVDGAHGIAHVLENLGHHDAADELLAGAATLVEQTRDHGLGGGLSGIALNLLHFAGTRRDPEYAARATELGERLLGALGTAPPPDDVGRAGLLGGWSGPALLFVRLYEHTGDRAWLEHADRALARDVAECVETDDGALQVRDGGARTLPYAAVGSAGIALVAEELAAHAPDAPSLAHQPALLRACRGEFVIHPGLLFGRCGLLAALAAARRRDPDPALADAVALHLSRLALYAIPYGEGGIAVPGNQLLRLSMDVNTGGAGVLLALAATLDGHGAVLPFLGGSRPAPSH
ncbi:Protein kinase domain-containing protein [Amycolatopsis arida]|uniref:Protein kinase domain-containing protein n=1 Tax=Amycolatopsis arida TaxID=587909 RepID=A0A1I5SM49_9PSEU|nr:class III lanthionine synthetase LanKC [Amycolatopsis arida]TDX96431.1 protein kinase-like protein [Amycolatopsis arida]SFP71721.1 Protein kinase domain-containing protein [Amycolatopsis arida]